MAVAVCLSGVAEGTSYHNRSSFTEHQLSWIERAHAAFFEAYGVLPPEPTWFAELTAHPSAVINTNRITYIEFEDALDLWGNPYGVRAWREARPGEVMVWSMGEDGLSATRGDDPDDLNNWNAAKPWRNNPEYQESMAPRTFERWFKVVWGVVIALWVLVGVRAGIRVFRP